MTELETPLIDRKRVKEIRRKTRRKFSSEEKIRIVLDGLLIRGSAFGQEPSFIIRKIV